MHDSHSRPKSLFHFRVFSNGEQLHESDALAFDDMEEVWHEGAMSSCELIRAMYGRIETDTHWRLDVTDDTGEVIYRFSFRAEKLGSASDGGRISEAAGITRQEVLAHAENSLRLASVVPDKASRAILREMAAAWLKLVMAEPASATPT